MLALLKRHGRTATSFQALEPGLRYWFDADDACVAYADTGAAWVTVGAPLASAARERAVMADFAAAGARAGRRVRWFGLERDLADADGVWRTLEMGRQPCWDPAAGQHILATKSSLREQLRRARAKGVAVRRADPAELGATDHPTRQALERLITRWLTTRPMPPLRFAVEVAPFSFPEERRCFLAHRGPTLVAALIAVPIYQSRGWLLEDALRDPEAPNGTMELLFFAALDELATEGSGPVTFGLAPLAETRSRTLRWIARLTPWLYHFDGLHRFKAKLQPEAWLPVYLGLPRRERGVAAVVDLLTAFSGGSLLRFAWATARHRAPVVVRILALLLVPWTVLLWLADARWFPGPVVQIGWVALDVLLFVGLMHLARRWRKRLALLLALAAAADFAVGLLQVVLHNLPRVAGACDVVLIGLALMAPLAAAIFLWAAREWPQISSSSRSSSSASSP